MQLEGMWIHGYRRFGGEAPHKLRLDSPLVCLIGANEVGKSSLLEALELGYVDPGGDPGEGQPVTPSDRTRDEDIPDDREIVRLRYRLDESDRKALRKLKGGRQLRDVLWLERKKLAGGAISTDLVPPPTRNKTRRHALAKAIQRLVESGRWVAQEEAQGTAADAAIVTALTESLGSNAGGLTDQTLAQLDALATWLEELGTQATLATRLRSVAEVERLPHPATQALEELAPRVPKFVRFSNDVRELADEYDLAEIMVEGQVHPALANLARLAELDVVRLAEKIRINESGTVKDLLDEANEHLRKRFTAWKQRPAVTASFDHSGSRILVHVKSGSGTSMLIGERSDGLRQFVSLVALTAQGHAVPPVLLIDEVEMHLHYDGQADLIAVLAEQTAASQVIYSTHSAASLPEDLGSAVRVVQGIGDKMASKIAQQFWSEDSGLGALLLAMGAGSLAFVPLRPAIIVEGGSDLVLLPSLLKEAVKQSMLGYQIVPGAATAPPTRIAGLDLQGIRTVWVLDGDASGRERSKYLTRNGVESHRILFLKQGSSGIDLEDLIDPGTYVTAINGYARDVGCEATFETSELPSTTCSRHRTVRSWFEGHGCLPPSKTAIAGKVIELRPDLRLLDPIRQAALRRLHRSVETLLKPTAS